MKRLRRKGQQAKKITTKSLAVDSLDPGVEEEASTEYL